MICDRKCFVEIKADDATSDVKMNPMPSFCTGSEVCDQSFSSKFTLVIFSPEHFIILSNAFKFSLKRQHGKDLRSCIILGMARKFSKRNNNVRINLLASK